MKIDFSKTSDTQLIANLRALNVRETETTAELLLNLIEVERRKIYRDEGYDSLFSYCCRDLKYSESAANRRISAARLIGRFPELLGHFCKQEVNLTTLSLISGVLNEESYSDIVPRILRKSRTDVERIKAEYRPKAKVVEYVKSVAIARPVKKEAPAPLFNQAEPREVKPAPVIEERVEVRFTLSKEEYAEFLELKALLSGKFPKGATVGEVFKEAVACTVKRLSPKKKSERNQPPPAEVKGDRTRYIPQPVRRAVYVRDGGCCTYVSKDGTRCGSRHRVQYHHRNPFARGGEHTAENITLLCAAHNGLLAERDFGREYMLQFGRAP